MGKVEVNNDKESTGIKFTLADRWYKIFGCKELDRIAREFARDTIKIPGLTYKILTYKVIPRDSIKEFERIDNINSMLDTELLEKITNAFKNNRRIINEAVVMVNKQIKALDSTCKTLTEYELKKKYLKDRLIHEISYHTTSGSFSLDDYFILDYEYTDDIGRLHNREIVCKYEDIGLIELE